MYLEIKLPEGLEGIQRQLIESQVKHIIGNLECFFKNSVPFQDFEVQSVFVKIKQLSKEDIK